MLCFSRVVDVVVLVVGRYIVDTQHLESSKTQIAMNCISAGFSDILVVCIDVLMNN